jgi:hypothetical protein
MSVVNQTIKIFDDSEYFKTKIVKLQMFFFLTKYREIVFQFSVSDKILQC